MNNRDYERIVDEWRKKPQHTYTSFEEFVKEQTIKTWTKAAKPVKTLSVFL